VPEKENEEARSAGRAWLREKMRGAVGRKGVLERADGGGKKRVPDREDESQRAGWLRENNEQGSKRVPERDKEEAEWVESHQRKYSFTKRVGAGSPLQHVHSNRRSASCPLTRANPHKASGGALGYEKGSSKTKPGIRSLHLWARGEFGFDLAK
jgi:hypothetical protein